MARKRPVISNMPLRSGLATAGQQGTVAENQLWRAENLSAGLDGLLTKRPGISKWGQTLKQPSASATGEYLNFYEAFGSTGAWRVTNGDEDTYVVEATGGELVVHVAGDNDADTLSLGRALAGGETAPTGHDWSLRFTMRTLNLPRGDADAGDSTVAGGSHDGGTLTIRGRALSSDTPKSFRMYYDGVYYWSGAAWVQLVAADIGDGNYHTIELRVDVGGNVTAYVDDDDSGTVLATSVSNDAAMTAGEYVELVLTNDPGTWTCRLTDFMYKDGVTDPFDGQRVYAVSEYKTRSVTGVVRRCLVAATSSYVYADVGLRKVWCPIMALTGGQPQFASYREHLIIFDGSNDNSSKVYTWDGEDAPEVLSDAPHCMFGSEHGTSLFVAGDKQHPRRVYFCASRQPNVWFAPDVDGDETYEEVTEAGYIEIPGTLGDSVTAIHGDFFGMCLVSTTRGLWRIDGRLFDEYTRDNVARELNGASPQAFARVGNDVYMLGRTGVTSVQTTQNFGDLMVAAPSAPISNLWSIDPNIADRIDQGMMEQSILAFNPTLSLLYMVVPEIGRNDLSAIYVYHVGLQQWFGPWDSTTTALACVEVADPVTRTMLHGTSDGKLGITDPSFKSDFGDTNYSVLFESPDLSGRSLDPALTAQVKTWKTLRLFIQPRGNWDLVISWSVDNENEQTRTESQNVFQFPALDDTFILDDSYNGVLESDQLIGVIEVPLDARGRYLRFKVETADNEDGEDLVLQGYEVEFKPVGPEQDEED